MDLTERKRSEEALRASEERYRNLFSKNVAGVFRATIDGRILEANDACARIFGFSTPEDFVRVNPLSLHGSPEARRRLLERLSRDRAISNEELTMRRQDGTEICLLVNLALENASEGGTFEGTFVDITDRKRAEEALERSEARYRSIFDSATMGIFQAGEDGSLLTVNRALAAMLGYESPEELLAMNLDRVYLDREDRKRLHALAMSREEATFRFPTRWRKKSGEPISVEIDKHAVRDPRGRVLYLEGFVHDVTGRNRSEEHHAELERQLAQSQKIEAVGQLAGGIAHDFNNILTAIGGYSELLINSIPEEDPRRIHAEEIRKSANRAAILTRQLLAFSRRQVLAPEVLDLNAVVENMERMLDSAIGEHIRLETRKAADLGLARADPGQIEQALLNLVMNARDAMPGGGDLTIVTAPVTRGSGSERDFPLAAGRYCTVSVVDTGIGMTPAVKARLFEPFFTTKERGKGTGLGLSTTYGIVKQSGGYISCASEPGRGTTFTIFLPCVDEPLENKEAPPARPVERVGHEKILLVEDEPEVRLLLQKILAMQGYQVVAAASPEEALSIEPRLPPDVELMITDVVMPGMTGRVLADLIAVSRPAMKVLFISGYTDDAIVDGGVLKNGTEFLQKPFSPSALARKVREVLDRRSRAGPPPNA